MIVFENLHAYLRLNKWNRSLLDKYCQHYGAGLVLFSNPAAETVFDSPLIGIPDLTFSTNVKIKVKKVYLVYLGDKELSSLLCCCCCCCFCRCCFCRCSSLVTTTLEKKDNIFSRQDLRLNPESPVLRVLKAGQVISGRSGAPDWTTFDGDEDPAFVPIATAVKWVPEVTG